MYYRGLRQGEKRKNCNMKEKGKTLGKRKEESPKKKTIKKRKYTARKPWSTGTSERKELCVGWFVGICEENFTRGKKVEGLLNCECGKQ